MSTLRPTVRPAVRAATRPSSGLYQSKIVLVDATLRRYMGTFTRNGTATYFDSSGVLQTAAANVPRWQYDPSTGQLQGLLIEGSSTNLLPYSSDFSQWQSDGPTVQQGGVGLDDSPAWEIITSTAPNANQSIIGSASLATGYLTYTVYAKLLGSTQYYLVLRGGGLPQGTAYATFDLAAGTVSDAGGSEYVTSTIRPLSGGYYRCTMTANYATAPESFQLEIWNSATGEGGYWPGDGVSGFYLAGAQCEQSQFSSSLIYTSGSPATRAADNAVINDLSGFDLTKGTFVVELLDNTVNAGLILVGANYVALYSPNNGVLVQTSGANPSLAGMTPGQMGKFAFTYDSSGVQVCVNGGRIATSTGTWSLGTSLHIAPKLNSALKSLTYYPYAMTAAQLQAATS